MARQKTDEPTLTLATPGDWLAVDLEALGDERAVTELIGPRIEALPALAKHGEELAATVTRTAENARTEGVVFAAVLATLHEDGSPVIANLTVAVVPTPPPEEAAEGLAGASSSSLDALEQGLDAEEPGVAQRAVDRLMLPLGPVIRIARIHNVGVLESGPQLAVLTVQYWGITPDRGQLVVCNFSTPALALHRDLAALFHEIVLTLRFDGDTPASDGEAVASVPAAVSDALPDGE
jgi:hypothetical protein